MGPFLLSVNEKCGLVVLPVIPALLFPCHRIPSHSALVQVANKSGIPRPLLNGTKFIVLTSKCVPVGHIWCPTGTGVGRWRDSAWDSPLLSSYSSFPSLPVPPVLFISNKTYGYTLNGSVLIYILLLWHALCNVVGEANRRSTFSTV